MQNSKRPTITFVFLIYFLYVIPSLYYAEDKIDKDSAITHTAKYDIKNFRVIWKLILSRLFQKGDMEDSRSGLHFFIKKDRAVLSSNNTVKAAQSESEMPSLNDHFPRLESVTFSAVVSGADPQRGFYSLFSGLSPPCV